MQCHISVACPNLGTLGHRVVPTGGKEEVTFSATLTVGLCELLLVREWAIISRQGASLR